MWACFHLLPSLSPGGAKESIKAGVPRAEGPRTPESTGGQSCVELRKSFPERVSRLPYLYRAWNHKLMMTLGHQTTQMWSFQEQASKLARCTSLFTPAPTPSIKSRRLRADEGFPGDQLI